MAVAFFRLLCRDTLHVQAPRLDLDEARRSTFLRALAGAVLAASLAAIVWGLDRGFDFGDEGYYLVSAHDPSGIPTLWTITPRLIHLLVDWAEPSILSYRILRLLLELIAGASFAFALSRWLRARDASAARGMAPFVALGVPLAYAEFSRGLSYNTLNDVLMLLASAQTLALLEVRMPNRRVLLALGAGASFGLQTLVKAPAGVTCAAATALLLAVLGRGRLLAPMLLGMLGAAGLTTAVLGVMAQPLTTPPDHELRLLARVYAVDALALVRTAVVFIPLGIMLLVDRRVRDRMPRGARLIPIAQMFACIAPVAWLHGPTGFHAHATQIYIVLFALGALLLALETKLRNAGAELAVALWLAALPVAASLGTANPLTARMLVHLVPWLGATWLIAGLVRRHTRRTGVATGGLVLAIALVPLFVVDGYMAHPYGLPRPLSEQRQPVELPRAHGLRFDTESARFLNELGALLRRGGFEAGTPIFALHDTPGLVYLAEGVSPGTPWYQSGPRIDERTCEAVISAAPFAQLPWLFLSAPLRTEIARCLTEAGVDYPAGYIELGRVRRPGRAAELVVLAPRMRAHE